MLYESVVKYIYKWKTTYNSQECGVFTQSSYASKEANHKYDAANDNDKQNRIQPLRAGYFGNIVKGGFLSVRPNTTS